MWEAWRRAHGDLCKTTQLNLAYDVLAKRLRFDWGGVYSCHSQGSLQPSGSKNHARRESPRPNRPESQLSDRCARVLFDLKYRRVLVSTLA